MPAGHAFAFVFVLAFVLLLVTAFVSQNRRRAGSEEAFMDGHSSWRGTEATEAGDWTDAVLPPPPSLSATTQNDAFRPDLDSWQRMLRQATHPSPSNGAPQPCSPAEPGQRRLVQWSRRGLTDALSALARGWGLRLGPARVTEQPACVDAVERRRTSWNVLACFFEPGQPKARCARLSVLLDASAPDPVAWTHTIISATDAGSLSESIMIASM